MYSKSVVIFVLLFCNIFESAVATGLLFNALKNTIKETRCKLHEIGSKIVQHEHQGHPCEKGNQDNSQFGSQNGYNANGLAHGTGQQPTYNGDPYWNTDNPSSNHPSPGYPIEISQNTKGMHVNTNGGSKRFPNRNINPETTTKLVYTESTTLSNEYKKQEERIREIFGTPQQNGGDSFGGTLKVTSETYPSSLDIDIRAGSDDNSQRTTTKKYAEVPKGGGRHVFKVNCPGGKTPTNSGECVEEI